MGFNSAFKGLMNLTMFSPLIMASNSSFRRILHNSFSFTGPYIFRKIFFSNTANALSSSSWQLRIWRKNCYGWTIRLHWKSVSGLCPEISHPNTFSRHLKCILIPYHMHVKLNWSFRKNNEYKFFFAVALRPNAGHDLLILEVSRSRTATHHSR